jgi:rhamnosyltransferase
MPHRTSARGKICAVLVAYHPDDGLPGRLRPVLAQVDMAVIVDNGSNTTARAMLARVADLPAVTLICNPENLGMATALNSGVRHALAGGCEWALLLDQDSEVDADLIDGLLSARADCPVGPVAIVGARFRDSSGQSIDALRLAGHGEQWDEVESVITSGSLLWLPAYAAIGPFRDDFFIDHVDTEFCRRARSAGHRIIQTRRPFMSHTVGAPSAHKMPWGTKWTTNHSPDRRYYIARNDTVMLRDYGPPRGGGWRLKSISRCFRLIKRIALYEGDKLEKIRAVGQGWWDGVHGRMGRRR